MRRRQTRAAMRWETLFGFLLFFAIMAFLQAVINVLRPEPQVWPALFAAAMMALAATAFRRWRRTLQFD